MIIDGTADRAEAMRLALRRRGKDGRNPERQIEVAIAGGEKVFDLMCLEEIGNRPLPAVYPGRYCQSRIPQNNFAVAAAPPSATAYALHRC